MFAPIVVLDAWVELRKTEESFLWDLSEHHPELAFGRALDDDDPGVERLRAAVNSFYDVTRKAIGNSGG